jgi:hypothetical protein
MIQNQNRVAPSDFQAPRKLSRWGRASAKGFDDSVKTLETPPCIWLKVPEVSEMGLSGQHVAEALMLPLKGPMVTIICDAFNPVGGRCGAQCRIELWLVIEQNQPLIPIQHLCAFNPRPIGIA